MYRLRIAAADADTGRTIAGRIEESVEHPPLAVSLFEVPDGGWTVDAYYESNDAHALVSEIVERTASGKARLALEAVPDENWVAVSQAGLPPVAAGRFLIHGSHDRAVGRHRRNAIEIDAGEAFGTAHHATTLGCLLAIDRLTRSRAFCRVLDLGSGSGVLAISAARALPAASVMATDNDPEAVRVATDNVRKNGLASRIRPFVAPGLDHAALRRSMPFDLVIANILADPLVSLAPHMARAVAPQGTIVLSGILAAQAPRVLAAYAGAGFTRRQIDRLNGWTILTLERRGGPSA